MKAIKISAVEPCTFNNQFVSSIAAELGTSIIDRAKWIEKTKRKCPYLIAEIKTLLFDVQLNYIGKCGDYIQFSLVDKHCPYLGGSHGYPMLYEGNPSDFFMEIVRELWYINSIHQDNE